MGRDITKCHPRLQELSKQLVNECKKQGLIIKIGECYRTVAEQDTLYAQGRTTPGSIITNARGSSYSSHHQWGTAFDFFRNDGTGAYNESGKFFERVGAIGVSLGLEWGGNWKSPVDKPHFQLPDWGSTTSKLKQLYSNPDNFKNTWVSSTPKSCISKGDKGADVKTLQENLIKLGYGLGKYGADGDFGTSTDSAVKDFQKKNGLSADGLVGKSTQSKIAELISFINKKIGWVIEDGHDRFYENGQPVKNRWIQSADMNDWYYLMDNTNMAVFTVLEIDSKLYGFSKDGKMFKAVSDKGVLS